MGTGDLKGSLVTLRLVQHDFLEAYCAMFSPAVRRALNVKSLYAEGRYVLDWLATPLQDFFYGIFDNNSGLFVGAIAIRHKEQYAGQLYGWLNEDFWGRDFYQEALALIALMYFKKTQELFFTAHVDIGNQRGYYALKKCGFADMGFVCGPYGLQYKLLLRRK